VFPGGRVFLPGGGAGCVRLLGDFHQALGRASICDMVGVTSQGTRVYLDTLIAFNIIFEMHHAHKIRGFLGHKYEYYGLIT
jgi:hypothetical protein